MNLLKKLECVSRNVERKFLREEMESKEKILTCKFKISQLLKELGRANKVKAHIKKRNVRDIADLNLIITSKLLLLNKQIVISELKLLVLREQKIKLLNERICNSLFKMGYGHFNLVVVKRSVVQATETIEKNLVKIKDNLFYRISRSLKIKRRLNALRERIESGLREIIYKILKDSQNALSVELCVNDKQFSANEQHKDPQSVELCVSDKQFSANEQHKDLSDEESKESKVGGIQASLTPKYTQINATQKQLKIEFLHCKITRAFLCLKSHILFLDEKFKDSITESFIFVLNKGSLETDKRFADLIQQTLREMEKFTDPVVIRMGIQFILAMKYVDDIIYLKERALLKKYLVCSNEE